MKVKLIQPGGGETVKLTKAQPFIIITMRCCARDFFCASDFSEWGYYPSSWRQDKALLMPLAPGKFARYCRSRVRKWGQTKTSWVTDKYEKRWKDDKNNKIQYDWRLSTVCTFDEQKLSVAHSAENSCRWDEYRLNEQPWIAALVCIIIDLPPLSNLWSHSNSTSSRWQYKPQITTLTGI